MSLEEELGPWLPRDFFVTTINRGLTLHDSLEGGPPSGAAIAATTAILAAISSIEGSERATGDGWALQLASGVIIRARRAADHDGEVNKSPFGPETETAIDVNRGVFKAQLELKLPPAVQVDQGTVVATQAAMTNAPAARTVHLMYRRLGGVVSARIIEVVAHDKSRFTEVRPGTWDLGTWDFEPATLDQPSYVSGVYRDVDVGFRDMDVPTDFSEGPRLRPVVAERSFEWLPAHARLMLSRMTPRDRDEHPDLADFLDAVAARLEPGK